ncbi:hypothetical protein V6N13_082496 [Hibiscus sabdariffa]
MPLYPCKSNHPACLLLFIFDPPSLTFSQNCHLRRHRPFFKNSLQTPFLHRFFPVSSHSIILPSLPGKFQYNFYQLSTLRKFSPRSIHFSFYREDTIERS